MEVVLPEGVAVAKAKGMHGGPRPGAGRPKSAAPDLITIKVNRDIVARARFVAETRGLTMTDYLAGILRPIVEKDFSKATGATGGGSK